MSEEIVGEISGDQRTEDTEGNMGDVESNDEQAVTKNSFICKVAMIVLNLLENLKRWKMTWQLNFKLNTQIYLILL